MLWGFHNSRTGVCRPDGQCHLIRTGRGRCDTLRAPHKRAELNSVVPYPSGPDPLQAREATAAAAPVN